jgi:hypothetical protein
VNSSVVARGVAVAVIGRPQVQVAHVKGGVETGEIGRK